MRTRSEARPMLGRRDFIRVARRHRRGRRRRGLTPLRRPAPPAPRSRPRPKQLVFELFGTMDADQKKKLVLPWDYKPATATAARPAS